MIRRAQNNHIIAKVVPKLDEIPEGFVKLATADPDITLDFIKECPLVIAELAKAWKATKMVNIANAGNQDLSLIKSVSRSTGQAVVEQFQSKLDDSISALSNTVSNLLFQQSKYIWNSGTKGNLAENSLADAIESYMQIHDCGTFSVSRVGNIKHCGDILIKYEGQADIIIELKDYESKPVPPDQVLKFNNDMSSSAAHGIMVSLNTKITDKNNFHIEPIPAFGNNVLFAAYIALDGDLDVSAIYNVVKVIHMLNDSQSALNRDKSDSFFQNIESVQLNKVCNTAKQVNLYMSGYYEKTIAIKSHAKSILNLAESFDFATVYKLIEQVSNPKVSFNPSIISLENASVMDEVENPAPVDKLVCAICNKAYASRATYLAHMHKHANLPSAKKGSVPKSTRAPEDEDDDDTNN